MVKPEIMRQDIVTFTNTFMTYLNGQRIRNLRDIYPPPHPSRASPGSEKVRIVAIGRPFETIPVAIDTLADRRRGETLEKEDNKPDTPDHGRSPEKKRRILPSLDHTPPRGVNLREWRIDDIGDGKRFEPSSSRLQNGKAKRSYW
jgi:hypothetical protein